MERFLVIHPVPEGGEALFRAQLERLAQTAHDMGLRTVETVYSTDAGRAYSLVEAGDEASVQEAARRAGVEATEVFRAERIFTELLDEPRRAR